MVPQSQPRKSKNSSKTNLVISLVFHGALVFVALYFAARTGVLGDALKTRVVTTGKEKPAEKPKEPEKPKEELPKEQPKLTVAPKMTSTPQTAAPPPSAMAPAAAAPAAVDVPSFVFDE